VSEVRATSTEATATHFAGKVTSPIYAARRLSGKDDTQLFDRLLAF